MSEEQTEDRAGTAISESIAVACTHFNRELFTHDDLSYVNQLAKTIRTLSEAKMVLSPEASPYVVAEPEAIVEE